MSKFLWFISVYCMSFVVSAAVSTTDNVSEDFLKEFVELSKLRANEQSLLSTSVQEDAVSITIIDQDDIKNSTARDVTELLDIYVPGLQVFNDHVLSLRGNASFSGHNYVVMIDGDKVDSRNFSSSYLWRNSMFIKNIERIEVIRGALSSVYGSGVLSGAINIITQANQGDQSSISLKKGAIHNYVTLEAVNSKKYDNGNAHFLYFGLSDVNGASVKNAPLRFVYDLDVPEIGIIHANDEAAYNVSNYEQNLDGDLDKVIHAEFSSGPMSYWFKHIQNSSSTGARDWQLKNPEVADYAKSGFKKEDFDAKEASSTSAGFRYNQFINDDAQFNFKYQVDELQKNDFFLIPIFSFESELAGNPQDVKNRLFHTAHKERKHLFNASLNYNINKENRVTLTNEYAYEKYGMDSSLDDDTQRDQYFHPINGAIDRPLRFIERGVSRPWKVHKGSVTAEHAYKPNNRFNLLSSLTYSWHEDTKSVLLPSIRGLFDFSDSLTGFASLSSAARSPSESEIRATQLSGGKKIDEFEDIRGLELGFSKILSPEEKIQTKIYHNKTNLIQIVQREDSEQGNAIEITRSMPIGAQEDYGLELEYLKETDRWTVGASYAYQKLKSLDLITYDDFNYTQFSSAAPYGYGDDLGATPQHSLKFHGLYKLDEKTNAYGSLNVSTGYDGFKQWSDYINRNNEERLKTLNADVFKKEKASLNLGVNSQLTKQLNVSLDAHDVLGWVDDDFNRLHDVRKVERYRTKPASISLSAEYEFH